MVNVEADALAGPLLARKAREKGVVYSLAWGDQPALVCEHVDWARACGFKVVAAGKGTRYQPNYHRSTPDTVWDILDKYLKMEDRKPINPKMFNSFIDGTKSGIEMTAVCNATGPRAADRAAWLPAGVALRARRRLQAARPTAARSRRPASPRSSPRSTATERDVPHHLAMGTYVVFEGETEYARRCFTEYPMLPDRSGRYAALYRPIHMIGLELGISVASAALRKEPTGAPICFNSDVVATAKRDAEVRRDARRGGRLLRLGQAAAGGIVRQVRLPAAGARPQRQAQARHRRGPDVELVRRRDGRERPRGQGPARDGERLRIRPPCSLFTLSRSPAPFDLNLPAGASNSRARQSYRFFAL